METKKFVCPLCGMEFDTGEEHNRHHEQIHNGASVAAELKCTVCGYTTRDEDDMKAHEKTHPRRAM